MEVVVIFLVSESNEVEVSDDQPRHRVRWLDISEFLEKGRFKVSLRWSIDVRDREASIRGWAREV